MKAKALITHEDQSFAIEEVSIPSPATDQALIRTLWSGVSVGTEFALIRNKISWGPYPLCTGYQATGVIEEVGSKVVGFSPGDKVYVRGGSQITLKDGRAVSSVSGSHASHILCKTGTAHSFDHLPSGCDPATASMFVMPAVGYKGVDMCGPKLGEVVVIHGCGLIGLGALAACVNRGCVIIAVDVNDRALDLAKNFGADFAIRSDKQNLLAEVKKIAPQGADVVFECTGIPACVNPTVELCRLEGSYVWQGNYGSAPVAFNFLPSHNRRLKMYFPCDDGYEPCRRAVLKHMAQGILPWEKTITHRIPYGESPAMFEAINQKKSDALGVVIDWTKAT